MNATESHNLASNLLAWYREMGVDAVVSDEAIDWLNRGDTKPGAGYVLPQVADPRSSARATEAPRERAPESTLPLPERGERRPALSPAHPAAAPRAFVATAPDAAVIAARTAAQGAQSIDDLGQLLASFDGCGLKATAKNLCFYRGAPKARLMIVGDAPGREEDLAGMPFVGPAGQLLDKMLTAIGLTGDSCHMTNAVYWRPPGNRTPTPQETDVCRPFLERQIALVAPDVLLLLGDTAARPILELSEAITRARGKWREIEIGGHRVKAMPTLHPNYLLRTPAAKQQVWRDLLAIKAALAN